MILRPVTDKDHALLLTWRNDPETRLWSFTEDAILPDVHTAWLQFALASGDVKLYIGEVKNQPVGLVRFHRRGNGVAEVSIVVAPDARGMGYGTTLLRLGCDRVLKDQWGVTRIEARVKPENLRSVALFKRVGFQETEMVLTLP